MAIKFFKEFDLNLVAERAKRGKREVVAVLMSDIHLSHKAPIARSAEPDWYVAQARPIRQARSAAKEHQVPVIIAGDIFDKWNVCPELITFAMEELPDHAYCIPGQHDLPFHEYNERRRAAYGTLVKAKCIVDLPTDRVRHITDHFAIRAFPWEFPVNGDGLEGYESNVLKLAVVHEYCWIDGATYAGAEFSQKAESFRKALKHYQAAVFGDNHKPFSTYAGDTLVFNHGTTVRRKSDERKYKTGYGLLYADGHIDRVRYDCSADLWLDESPDLKAVEAVEGHMSDFLSVLKETEIKDFSFGDALNTYLNTYQVSDGARKLLLNHHG
jgi:hypothetical protein